MAAFTGLIWYATKPVSFIFISFPRPYVKRIMDLKKQILKEHSKKQCTKKIVEWVGNNQKKFNELFHLFLSGEYRVTQRSAWPLSYCVIAHPHFMEDNYEELLGNLKKPNLHDSIKRNTVRLLQAVDIPEKHEGALWKFVLNI